MERQLTGKTEHFVNKTVGYKHEFSHRKIKVRLTDAVLTCILTLTFDDFSMQTNNLSSKNRRHRRVDKQIVFEKQSN